jgi:predicted nucleic acid-binding protein
MEEVRLLKALLDVNLLLDVFLDRKPWAADAQALWTAHHCKRFVGHVAAHGLTNLFYIARKVIGTEKARDAVRLSYQTFEILPIGRPELERADALPGTDIEDNLVLACATLAGLDVVVTRDPEGFAGSTIEVLPPAEFLKRLPKDDYA